MRDFGRKRRQLGAQACEDAKPGILADWREPHRGRDEILSEGREKSLDGGLCWDAMRSCRQAKGDRIRDFVELAGCLLEQRIGPGAEDGIEEAAPLLGSFQPQLAR